jgi:D-alanyl-lipoteichoic acid acyltransferase DltB (MBOAT superfamily)
LDYAQAVDGGRQILWGMFTKVCIADHLPVVTESVWSDYSSQSGSTLFLWTLLYTMQIYTDFDGYSNMAIGVSKILGFNITRNFNHPLLARNIAEFWRNWHISLTSWITDYVFMPLNIAFRNMDNWGVMLAVTINIVLIGLWHGSNWTFGLFGLYHALLYIPLVLSGAFGKNKKLRPNDYGLPKRKDFLKMVLNYVLVSLGFIVFYAGSVSDAFQFFSGILSTSLFTMPTLPIRKATIVFMLIVLILEWTTRKKEHPLQLPVEGIFRYSAVRYALYAGIGLLLFIYAGEVETFIYFKF